jgi:hypothetical protein
VEREWNACNGHKSGVFGGTENRVVPDDGVNKKVGNAPFISSFVSRSMRVHVVKLRMVKSLFSGL